MKISNSNFNFDNIDDLNDDDSIIQNTPFTDTDKSNTTTNIE